MDVNRHWRTAQQQCIRRHVGQSSTFAFFNLLTGPGLLEKVEALLPSHRERLFPPTETAAMFLAQVVSADRSCRRIVDEVATQRLLGHLPLCSTHTGAYCRARQRLPTRLLSQLGGYVGQVLTQRTPVAWRWRGRPVRLVDGTTVALPDTPANQAAYPQSGNQRPGLGFPQCRIVGLICLASGGLLNAATSACVGKGSDEQTLLRSIFDALQPNDILLADALYGTYFLLCALRARGCDGLFAQQGARARCTDFRRGQRLGVRDHVLELQKPTRKPEWMTAAQYAQAPATLQVRELRVGGKLLVTTLLCPKQTAKAALQTLYAQRWNIELDLRNIKTTLGMDILRCKTPAMVIKEICAYLLAYNLIRLLMTEAALLVNRTPRTLSFKHTVQMWSAWATSGTNGEHDDQLTDLLRLIGQHTVGNRAGRIEPRALKRRHKSYDLLTQHRHRARADVLRHGHRQNVK
jgi:Transposase DDE domain